MKHACTDHHTNTNAHTSFETVANETAFAELLETILRTAWKQTTQRVKHSQERKKFDYFLSRNQQTKE